MQRALLLEAVPALIDAGRPADAERLLDQPGVGGTAPLEGGRIQLLRAQAALAGADVSRARAIFDEGFTVENLREGDEALSDTWYAIAERLVAGDGPVDDAVRARARATHPLPAAYDFRMRPESQEPQESQGAGAGG